MYSDSDLKTMFLLGKNFNFNDICKLYSLTINEIVDMGFDKYNEAISILCITSDKIDEMFNYELSKTIEPFDFIFQNCIYDKGMENTVLNSFSIFFKEPVGLCESGFFIGEECEKRFITSKNYNFLIDVLKTQNCIEIEKTVKPKTEAQKKFFKRRKEMREKYKKKDDGIYHIISSVCAKHNSYNLLNIQQLTMFQLIDQYKRMHAIDEYFITINSMMHGASSEGSKLKHWSESID